MKHHFLSSRTRGLLSLVLLSVVFASMGIFARALGSEFTIIQQVYLRVLAALVLGLGFFFTRLDFSKLRQITTQEWLLLSFRACSLYVLGVTLFTKAIILAKYSNVSFIGALPVVAVLGFVILKEKVTLFKTLFIGLSLLGTMLLAVTDSTHLLSWGLGEVLALIATVFFGLSYVLRRWHSNLLNNQEMTLIMLLLASILLIVTSVLMGEGIPNPNHGWSITIVGVVITAGVFNIANVFLVNYGFEKVEAALANNVLMLESLFAVLIGMLLYHEVPALKELIGGGIILISVFGMNHTENSSQNSV